MIRAVVPLALLLSGCVNTIRFPPDLWSSSWDSGWTEDTGALSDAAPPRKIKVADASCDPDRVAWTVSARTDGWTQEARVNVFRTADAQEEEHLMRLVATDPEGRWDEVRAGPLPDATPVADQVPDVNTRFDCDADTQALSFVIRIWSEGDVLVDCAVWGADPEGAMARVRTLDPDILGLDGCRVIPD